MSERTYFDSSLPGFGLRVRRAGGRTYVVQYDFGGKTRRMTLGSTATLDLGTARAKAKEILAARTLGRDVAAEKQVARARIGDAFAALLERYLPHKKAQVRPRSFTEIERHFVKMARPLHSRPVAAIDRRAITELMASVAVKNGPVAANSMLGSLSAYFGWLLREGLIDGANPASYVNKAPHSKGRDRVHSPAELREIWNAAGDSHYGDIVRLLMLVPARKSEIGDLAWDELDLERAEINLPPSRVKNGRPHQIPLAPAPLAILKARAHNGRSFVFGRGRFGFRGWAWGKRELDKRIAVARKAAGNPAPMPGFVMHDFRRTFSTIMHDRLQTAPHVVEACLNHISAYKSGVQGTYNRAQYAGERRRSLERWAAFIDETVSGKTAEVRVIKLHHG
jgi:integrase